MSTLKKKCINLYKYSLASASTCKKISRDKLTNELSEDWVNTIEVNKNQVPLSSIETCSHVVPDLRAPDYDSWYTNPPPYNRQTVGRWACLFGILPCCSHCVDDERCCCCCCVSCTTKMSKCWHRKCPKKCSDKCPTRCCCCTGSDTCSTKCLPFLSCNKIAKQNDIASSSRTAGATTWWRSFVPAPALIDLIYESNRSQFLTIWNLSMLFMTLTLLLSPLTFGGLHNVSCQAALGFSPSFLPYFNANATTSNNETSGSKSWSPSFLTRWAGNADLSRGITRGPISSRPWQIPERFKSTNPTYIQSRGIPTMDWTTEWNAKPTNLEDAAAACAAACASDDVDVVANAYFMASTDMFSKKKTSSTLGSDHTDDNTKHSWATCGYFRSEYSEPSSAITTQQYSRINLYVRPLLIAMVNNRMNRFFGWAGIAWFVALYFDISILYDRAANDLRFCPSPFEFSVDPHGYVDYGAEFRKLNSNDTNAMQNKPTHFTCNISKSMMKQLQQKIESQNKHPPGSKNLRRVVPRVSNLACSSSEIEIEKKDIGLVKKIVNGFNEKDTLPWDQVSCSNSWKDAPCLNDYTARVSTKEELASTVNELEFYREKGIWSGGSGDHLFHYVDAGATCKLDATCKVVNNSIIGGSETPSFEHIFSSSDYNLIDEPSYYQYANMYLFGQGSTMTLPRLSACENSKTSYYMRTDEGKKAFEIRLIAFAKETKTTVKALQAEDTAVTEYITLLYSTADAWIVTRNTNATLENIKNGNKFCRDQTQQKN